MSYFIAMKLSIENSSAIILAGGNSSRMNYPKPWLKINSQVTFLASIINSFITYGIKDIVVVLNEKFTNSKWKNELSAIEKNCSIVLNNEPDKGRLYSLRLGLKHTKSNNVLIHNVDSPFVENEVLELLFNNIELNGITIPSHNEKGGHPVIISKAVKEEIINNYKNHKTLKEVFSNFPKKYIEVDSNSILKNINTPHDLKEVIHELA